MDFEYGAVVVKKGRTTKGEVVKILPQGEVSIGVQWPRRATVAYYSRDELDVVA